MWSICGYARNRSHLRLMSCGAFSPHALVCRDTCDHRMTCSTSSAFSLDTSAQFPENNGQMQSTRWDEQQKVFALEQVCGVFRVDLGQMRSLRLFFR